MRVSKGLWVGLLGALLIGGAQAVGEIFVSQAAGDADQGSAITVPVGRVGDQVTYAVFQRGAPTDLWVRAESPFWFDVLRTATVLDRMGDAHEAVEVFEDAWSMQWREGLEGIEGEDIANGSRINAYDLASRDQIRLMETWRIQETSHFVVTEQFGGVAAAHGPFPNAAGGKTAVNVPFKHGLHHGQTYTPGHDVSVWAQRRIAADLQSDASGLEISGRVGVRAKIDGEAALPLRLQGCVELPERWSGYPDVVVFYGVLPHPSRTCFEYVEWVTANSPYPVRIESRFDFFGAPTESGAHAEVLLDLTEYRAGSVPIPWGASPPMTYRENDERLERSPAPARHPLDGGRHGLPVRLSEAFSAISSDATLTTYRQWMTAHPQARPIGYGLLPFGPQLEGSRWTIVLGDPAGGAFVLFVERARPGASLIASQVGEFPFPTFAPTDFPTDHISLAAAHQRWSDFKLDTQGRAPNFVTWGHGFQPAGAWCPGTQTCSYAEARITHANAPAVRTMINYGYTSTDAGGGRSRLNFGLASAAPGRALATTSEGVFHTIDTQTGAVRLSRDDGHALDTRPRVPPALQADAPTDPATASTAPSPPGGADLTKSAVLTAGLISLVLLGYFWPLLKGVAAHALALFPGYAKTQRSRLLEHKQRDTLAAAIRADPGTTAPELQRIAGIGWSTTLYHLRLMQKNKLIASQIDGRHRRYFPVDSVPVNKRGRIAALQNARTKQLYHLLLAEPGLDGGDLAKRLGISRPGVYFHVERLEKNGLLGRDREGRHVRFYALHEAAPYDADAAVEVA